MIIVTKLDILQYYNQFFAKYPEKRYISGIIDSLERYDVAQKLSVPKLKPDGVLVSKNYLVSEELSEWDSLPDFLSIQELKKLDNQNENKLTWKLLDSRVTSNQISDFEQRWHIHVPKELIVYITSYASLLCKIESTFIEEDVVSHVQLDIPLMLWHDELADFGRDMYLEPIQLLSDLGYILVAIRDNYEWWCLDTESGVIVGFADDDDYSDIEDPSDKEYLFRKHGKLLFNSFSDFLRTCFSID